MQPLCSIVIPVYNGARYLRQAVDSALTQTYPHREILVVNDGSTDDTDAIARSYGDRITYIAKPNGGVATALNEGIRRMRGDYFSWLSHDDAYHPRKLEAQVAALSRPDLIVYSDVDLIGPEGEPLGRQSFGEYAQMSMLAALVLAWPVNGCAALVPRSCFDAVGNFSETLRTTQDYDLWFRLAQRYRFVHVAEALILSRLHPGQGSRTILVHARENDELYCRALEAQTAESLLSIPGVHSLTDGYLKLAQALTWRKRAFAASNHALKLAMRHAPSKIPPLDVMTTLGANLTLELPVQVIRRVRRYLAVRAARS